jgi:spore coat polysaccharide biosynthesis predicted glycosyltransferase SpsG
VNFTDINLGTNQLLIIGHTFPEPKTTAAGSRMMQLIDLFREENFQITFASTAAISERTANLEVHHISVKNILLNDASFDEFIKQLNPEIVIFDRYITEEQFGWRVSENCPNSLKILDTEDLHFLRKAREEAVKNNKNFSEANLFSETAKRELASILRCDV